MMADVTPIRELCEEYGISQADLAHRFGIPYRSLQDWYAGRRKPPAYVVRMIRTILEYEQKE